MVSAVSAADEQPFVTRRIVVFGNEFGAPQTLRCLPPDRVAGIVGASIRPRSHPVLRELAARVGCPILIQPKYVEREAFGRFLDSLGSLQPDLLFSNSYAMIVRPEMLRLANGMAVNVHWALLPRNRGPNPVQWAIIRGESETGITLHDMDEGIDTGDIVAQKSVPIEDDDTWEDLRAKLAQDSEDFLRQQAPLLLAGALDRTPQDETNATTNPRLTPLSPEIRFDTMTDREIYNLIRAQVAPLKGAYILTDGREIRSEQRVPFAEIEELRRQYGQTARVSSRRSRAAPPS